ncbi:hypothetical protein TorRG33x02_304440 [Trema orientale]|uniref:Uncharacterized protein n=1 Tax=Trema orientale TaxID=63057 RepID=A0A2P5BY78_TREOI|nr:hypothetical protein TorRG33x02_304440 [Trema orientale]
MWSNSTDGIIGFWLNFHMRGRRLPPEKRSFLNNLILSAATCSVITAVVIVFFVLISLWITQNLLTGPFLGRRVSPLKLPPVQDIEAIFIHNEAL